MDYKLISDVAQAACIDALKLVQSTRPVTIEQQAEVYTSGIVAAMQEYERQKAEN